MTLYAAKLIIILLMTNLQQKLSNALESVIDEDDLFNKIELLPMFIDNCTIPLDLLKYLFSNSLISVFLNLSTMLRMYITLPDIVAHNERSFFKLKLIKLISGQQCLKAD